jgi:hypothetical protein
VAKLLYDEFVAWVIETKAKDFGEFGNAVPVDALESAVQEWRDRMNTAGRPPKRKADRKPIGRQRQIPQGLTCQNPHFCSSPAVTHGPDGLYICCSCRRRWRQTGSLEFSRKGRPPTMCDCGERAKVRGRCTACDWKHQKNLRGSQKNL